MPGYLLVDFLKNKSIALLTMFQTARGDINGIIFDHLMAARSILLPLLSAGSTLTKALKEFLVEYYVYTATVGMISIDTRLSDQVLLDDEIVLLATELVASAYVGNLCGCWLDLIMLIPSIFSFSRNMMAHDDGSYFRPSADDFLLYAQILQQIENWMPNPSVDPEVAAAGYIYQKAMLLYLHTTLHPLSRGNNTLQTMAIQNALAEALANLAQLPPTSRVNTSLCWPIAVIGSCVIDQGQQIFLRDRLEHMFAAIGLGNIRQTSILLQHLWADGHGSSAQEGMKMGPWDICHVMNERQIWVSFA